MKNGLSKIIIVISAICCVFLMFSSKSFTIISKASSISSNSISIPKTASNPQTSYVSLKDPESVFCLRIYPKINTESNICAKLKEGTKVISYSETVVNENITWVKIKANDKIGWINKNCLFYLPETSSNPKTSFIKLKDKDSIFGLRILPKTNSINNVISRLKAGTKVTAYSETIVNENIVWVKVKSGNNIGWINQKCLSDVYIHEQENYWCYTSEESKVTIEKFRRYNSDVYIADIEITDAKQFKHVYASDTLDGTLRTVTDMTNKYNPIIAINATGFNKEQNNLPMGTVGALGKINYFSNNRASIAMGYNGMLNIVDAKTPSDYIPYKPFWISSFGRSLVSNYNLTQTEKGNTNIPLAPRTAIGQKDSPNKFIVIVVDGRTSTSPGVNYYQLATLFKEKEARIAYNLDGGGSTTLTFMGNIINKPSDPSGPRKVLDALFIRDIK